MSRPWWMPKPYQNRRGVIPKPLYGSPRRIKEDLLPKVENLVIGGAIPKPLWLDAARANPPPPKIAGRKPEKFEWREEDRLRRVWQRRNPEAASTFPKVLFLDESSLPPGTQTEHPADEFISKQMELMRRGLSEEEAYRRVQQHMDQQRRVAADDVASARAQASALGASPAEGPGSGDTEQSGASAPTPRGFAEQLLRRFAEEARDGNQPYPTHWFNADGSWRGIGDPASEISARTMRALNRTGRSTGLFQSVTFRSDDDAAKAAFRAEAEADAALAEADDDDDGQDAPPEKER